MLIDSDAISTCPLHIQCTSYTWKKSPNFVVQMGYKESYSCSPNGFIWRQWASPFKGAFKSSWYKSKLPSGPFQITKACSWVICPIYGSNYWIRCFLFNLIFLLHPFQFPSFRLNAINAKGRDKLSCSTIWFKDWKFEPTSLFWFFSFFGRIAKQFTFKRK